MKRSHFEKKIKKLIPMGLVTILSLTSCNNLKKSYIQNYNDPGHKKVEKAGFAEKTFFDGKTTVHYVEGPDNGPILVLLHAQMMDWFDYNKVLPELSKSFHIYDVDYYGHGKTSASEELMNANSIGNSLASFIEAVIKEPVFITGNSSGGLLTAWVAANKPELVKAILLEDPPLLASEYPEVKNTIAFRSFTTCHNYIEEGSKDDFLSYWLNSSKEFIAKRAGENALPKLLSAIDAYREAHPGEPVELRFLPDMLRMVIRGMSQFDPAFGNSFYEGTWNEGFDHAKTLKKIQCPALLLQANFEIREDGILDGAMNQEQADRVISLIPNAQYKRIDASHVVHLDKPKEFIQITREFFLNGAY